MLQRRRMRLWTDPWDEYGKRWAAGPALKADTRALLASRILHVPAHVHGYFGLQSQNGKVVIVHTLPTMHQRRTLLPLVV